ncbi:aldo/keto reductase [Hymenobacter latericus]|uniref:aldo/keto reductase n=1 Tax=Hymenobacter sp. YIM 151858-1 TaxID=2987688 RepID=UPI0022269169|nr:aldo/keto reductase [Hymenobacter sp. YIM 151858-1]UYZ60314.1 aldo/keto reductase [Hymenobacter sp. YIM 151858-1]
MKYNHLGKSKLEVSEIGFGCMSLGPDMAESGRLLRLAFEQGINYFDTADLYDRGQNETAVGRGLRGVRQQVVIASKVGNQWRPDGSGWDWNPRKAYILEAAEQSLRRLQTDYLDLYQLHGGTLDDPIDEVIEAFELLQQQGKIRYYGISSIRPNVIRAYAARSQAVSVMMQYSLLDRRPEETCLPLLEQHQISVLARGSYAQGLLLGKAAKSYLGHSAEQVARAAGAVRNVAGTRNTAAGVAARFVLHPPAVASAVIGIRTAAHLREALAASQAPALTAEELETLRQAVPALPYEQHR